jgi:hypothetical protein
MRYNKLGAPWEAIQTWKVLWGVAFATVFLALVLSFATNALKAQGIKYNWFRVVLAFLTIGLAIYLVFFVQV